MEKAKERMKKQAQNGKSHILQRNPLNSPGNLQEMKMTKTAKRRKTKAALRVEMRAVTQETQLQTCRKPVKGPNYHNECCILRETTRRLYNQHTVLVTPVCMCIIHILLCCVLGGKDILAFFKSYRFNFMLFGCMKLPLTTKDYQDFCADLYMSKILLSRQL
uniref:Uncharacterized protein n=1 Tax=Saimiri boliviensis boliviensis TaxID=39432 RepID=A0A2K6UZH2_SAIBB